MLNGLLTLRGAWDKVRQDPMLKFMVVAVTAYGMATLEGPTLAVKSVNALSHYTDWTIAHVHTGALGWNGFLTFSLLYWLFPRCTAPGFVGQTRQLPLLDRAAGHDVLRCAHLRQRRHPGPDVEAVHRRRLLLYGNFLETVIRIIPCTCCAPSAGPCTSWHRAEWVTSQDGEGGQFDPGEEAHAPAVEVAVAAAHAKPAWSHRWLRACPSRHRPHTSPCSFAAWSNLPLYLIKSNVPTISTVSPIPCSNSSAGHLIREGCLGCHSQMVRRSLRNRAGMANIEGGRIRV